MVTKEITDQTVDRDETGCVVSQIALHLPVHFKWWKPVINKLNHFDEIHDFNYQFNMLWD